LIFSKCDVAQRRNRTIVGLKRAASAIFLTIALSSQSHHSGIETQALAGIAGAGGWSQSHHSGIETLNFRLFFRDVYLSQSHHSGIETMGR
jgi:hypothetical protein